MRTTKTAPARPVPITALALTATGSLLLTPHTAGAGPKPATREGAALDRTAPRSPVITAERALARTPAPGPAEVRGYKTPVFFNDNIHGDEWEDPLVSGHWRALPDGSGGPAAAAGRPSAVSGTHAVLFGTEPLFRDPPEGGVSPDRTGVDHHGTRKQRAG